MLCYIVSCLFVLLALLLSKYCKHAFRRVPLLLLFMLLLLLLAVFMFTILFACCMCPYCYFVNSLQDADRGSGNIGPTSESFIYTRTFIGQIKCCHKISHIAVQLYLCISNIYLLTYVSSALQCGLTSIVITYTPLF